VVKEFKENLFTVPGGADMGLVTGDGAVCAEGGV